MFESNNNSSNLWEKLKDRHEQKRKQYGIVNNVFQPQITQPQNDKQNNLLGDTADDWNKGIQGFTGLYNSLKGNTNKTDTTGGSGLFSSLFGNKSSGSAIIDAINGNGSSGSAITDSINNYMNSGSSSASSSGGGTPWALVGVLGKSAYNGITGHDDKNYSDTEESIVYPLQGATIGASLGPVGAAIGGLYGLGYSLKDDIGLKDSNFMTKALFPIDMGGDYADWL